MKQTQNAMTQLTYKEFSTYWDWRINVYSIGRLFGHIDRTQEPNKNFTYRFFPKGKKSYVGIKHDSINSIKEYIKNLTKQISPETNTKRHEL